MGLLYFTLAAGLAVVFGSADILNLAHGTLYLGGAYVAWRLTDGSWLGMGLAVLCGLLAGAAAGGLLSWLTAPLARRGHLDQALLTLGVSLLGAEAVSIATDGEPVPSMVPLGLNGSVHLGTFTYPVYRLGFIACGLVIAAAVWLVLERSRAGAIVRAVVSDREMAAAQGIRPKLVLLTVFTAGSGLAVLGGVLGAPILPAAPGTDEHVLVMSLIVIVIGGTGSIKGTLIASLLVGQVETLGRALLPQTAAFALYAVMLAALIVRPGGLLGAARVTT
jgi:branched-chain amino acid transport system permease protein